MWEAFIRAKTYVEECRYANVKSLLPASSIATLKRLVLMPVLSGCFDVFITSCICPACIIFCHAKPALPKCHRRLRNATAGNLCSHVPRLPCRAQTKIVKVTFYQMPLVRVGLALLLLCGMVLPALMDAFSKFSWTVLVVQLFFAQSYWSIHEMSRAMEKQFLWDLDDTHVAEYQVLGCYVSQLLCLQILQVQCQSCACLLRKASKLICYLPCLQVACPSVRLRVSMYCQQYAFERVLQQFDNHKGTHHQALPPRLSNFAVLH